MLEDKKIIAENQSELVSESGGEENVLSEPVSLHSMLQSLFRILFFPQTDILKSIAISIGTRGGAYRRWGKRGATLSQW